MLKKIRALRNAQKYTLIVDHTVEGGAHLHGAEDGALDDAMRVHVVNLHHVVKSLGHRPEGLVGMMKKDAISARAIVHLKDDEAAAQMLTLVGQRMCSHTSTRIVQGELTRALHDHPLAPASGSASAASQSSS